MSVFTPEQVIEAVKTANASDSFPLREDASTLVLLAEACGPALESLPPHLRCEVVAVALQSMFVMGIGAGVELGRGQ